MSQDDHSENRDGNELGRRFSEESRRALGMEPKEALRVLARSGRAILLERGDAAEIAVPQDRDLVLSSDVRAFALADLLSLVHGTGKSGFLLFQYEGEEKAVYLSRGEVVFAESNLPADRLGASLLRSGLIDQAGLDLAERHYHPMTRFGKIVVEQGILTPRELWNGVKAQVEDIVRSLFSYTGGWIHFWEGEIEPDNVVRLSLPTNRLIGEGLERRDALLCFLAQLEDPRTRIVVEGDAGGGASENERAVLEALALEADFAPVCHRVGLDPRTTARTLQFLVLAGQVSIEREPALPESDAFNAADDDVVREAVELHAKLIFELAAPLVALDGASDVAERLNRIIEDSAAAGRTMLEGIRVSDAATLDPGLLTDKALGLAGDRVREIDEALGEIVAYLEFELKNHPQIDDCSAFLEAVDPLRAMLIR